MTAALRFDSDCAAIAPVQYEDEDDYWCRVMLVARLIPADVDCDDDAYVVRSLMAARLCSADFDDCLSDAIARAKEIRSNDQD
jgi:hypothetical protein